MFFCVIALRPHGWMVVSILSHALCADIKVNYASYKNIHCHLMFWPMFDFMFWRMVVLAGRPNVFTGKPFTCSDPNCDFESNKIVSMTFIDTHVNAFDHQTGETNRDLLGYFVNLGDWKLHLATCKNETLRSPLHEISVIISYSFGTRYLEHQSKCFIKWINSIFIQIQNGCEYMCARIGGASAAQLRLYISPLFSLAASRLN